MGSLHPLLPNSALVPLVAKPLISGPRAGESEKYACTEPGSKDTESEPPDREGGASYLSKPWGQAEDS